MVAFYNGYIALEENATIARAAWRRIRVHLLGMVVQATARLWEHLNTFAEQVTLEGCWSAMRRILA